MEHLTGSSPVAAASSGQFPRPLGMVRAADDSTRKTITSAYLTYHFT
jgi:hypothetical protein